MDDKHLVEYLLKKDIERYGAEKEHQKTIRHTLITLILSALVAVCFYMYFVVPMEEYTVEANNGSNAIANSSVVESTIQGVK